MDKTIYVIGHKNPDTDSVVAAATYAALKRAQGMENVRAARAGAVNPQTEYIFQRFGVPLPEFIPDLVPKVEYYMAGTHPTVLDTMPLWDALARMGDAEHRALPIVDAEGRYKAILHYGAFAQNILAKINPKRKAIIPTSVSHMIDTIKAQPLVVFDKDEFFKARMVVAALSVPKLSDTLHMEPAENKVVLVGDREEAQRIAIEAGVRVVIITNGYLPSKEIRALAEQKRVSILVSPYDTSSTSLLVLYSAPVLTMGDDTIKPVLRRDLLRHAKSAIASSASRSVPVIDDDGRVVGMFAEGDLIREPNIEMILVDHNEFSQAVEGIEHYRILEVIDHHRLGVFSTNYPITFINRVVGSTSTIVATMFRESRTPLPRAIASILLCGILSDTLVLRSATVTEVDRDTADYLAGITGLEIDALGADIMKSASAAARMPVDRMVRVDRKEYDEGGVKMSVSQIELTSAEEIMERAKEIREGLASLRRETGTYLAALMATDITRLESVLFLDADKGLAPYLGWPEIEPGVYELKDILSRKKQLMPALVEMVRKARES